MNMRDGHIRVVFYGTFYNWQIVKLILNTLGSHARTENENDREVAGLPFNM